MNGCDDSHPMRTNESSKWLGGLWLFFNINHGWNHYLISFCHGWSEALLHLWGCKGEFNGEQGTFSWDRLD